MLIFRSAVIPDMPIKFLNPISISTALDIEHIACTTQHYSKRCNDAAHHCNINIFNLYMYSRRRLLQQRKVLREH